MNAARPAVQLCWPYQSVKLQPSFAMRSMLGVRYPMIPLLLQLTLNQPMSSPQMTRMLGFVVCGICPPFLAVTPRRAPEPAVLWARTVTHLASAVIRDSLRRLEIGGYADTAARQSWM